MGRGLTVPVALAVLLTSCDLSGQQAGPLLIAVNDAANLVKQDLPRTAIERYYRRTLEGRDSDLFVTGAPAVQQRFLFEYLMAADAAAASLAETADKSSLNAFYNEIVRVGESYLSWYGHLSPEVQRDIADHSADRPSKALFTLIEAYEHLGNHAAILTALEEVEAFPVFFRPRILDEWEKYLTLAAVD